MSSKRVAAVRQSVAAAVLIALGLSLAAPGPAASPAAGAKPGLAGRAASSPASSDLALSALPLSPSLQEAVVRALTAGQQQGLVHLAVAPGRTGQVAAEAQALGAEIVERLDNLDYLTVRGNLRRLPAFAGLPGVTGASLDGRFHTGSDPQSAYSDAPKPPADPGDPGNFIANREALRADEFTAATGADGRGVTIAVIDTGADTGHPDLTTTSAGDAKLVDWQDFSGEGDVGTSSAVRPTGSRLAAPGGAYSVPEGVSRSGVVHFGVFRDPTLGGEYGVIVVDSAMAGRYDRVYVDTNRNFNFADEQPLTLFTLSHQTLALQLAAGGEMRAVLTRVNGDGSGINLGFDGNGHGTHVAAIAAGARQEASGVKGIAPGASLMVLKALDSTGDGDWDQISRAMVYAAEHGAAIISMSVEGSSDHSGQSPEAQLMARLASKYNVLFVTAAGNGGPGIGSAGFPGAPQDVVSVGASMTPELWKRYYGLSIPHAGLLDFSAAGPRRDGTMGPTVVAPGVAVSAVPAWLNNSSYDFKWGTSMAAPHVAGAAAALLSAARSHGIEPSYRGLKAALEEGARPIPGYQVVEQGFGEADLPGAWDALQQDGALASSTGVDVTVQALAPGQATQGLDARSFLPGQIPFVIANPAAPGLRLFWRSTADWIKPQLESLTVPGKGSRILPVTYQVPAAKGLHSALLRGYPVATYGSDPVSGPAGQRGPAVDLLSTVVVPYEFSADNNWQANIVGVVEVAQYRRYFLQVPEGAGRLSLSLSFWRGVSNRATGRVELFLFRPDGRLLQDSSVVGDGTGSPSYDVAVDTPMAGTWEAVVLTPADYASDGQFLSLFQINASLQGVLFPEGTVHVSAPAGQVALSLTVPAVNRGGAFQGSVVGVGLGQPVFDSPPDLMTLREGEITTRDLPVVPAGTSLLRLSLTNPTRPGGRVNFTLYHKDDRTGAWHIVTPPGAAAGSQETMDLPDPAPGEYVVSFIGSELPGGESTYEYRETLLPAGDNIQIQDDSRAHASGERWTVGVTLRPPAQPGRYYGRLIARDAEGHILGYVPVEVSRGQIGVTAKLLPQELAPGEKGWATLEFRDDNGRPVSPLVTINGAVYQPLGGQITLPAGPGQADLDFTVKIMDTNFAYSEQTLILHVDTAAPQHDALGPIGTGQDFDWRYQKLLNEMNPSPGVTAP
ncbi:MAG: S8 family serine peptidase [Symbiobacteriia bacterium]